MRKIFIFLIASLACVPVASAWSLGEEQEVKPGIYVKLENEIDGWRYWVEETRDGKNCIAVKATKGFPSPLGSGTHFYSREAYIEIVRFSPYMPRNSAYNSKPTIDLNALWSGGKTAEFRRPEERFPKTFTGDEILSYDGQKIEVFVTSYEYPSIYSGRHHATGTLSLVGLSNAYDFVLNCSQ